MVDHAERDMRAYQRQLKLSRNLRKEEYKRQALAILGIALLRICHTGHCLTWHLPYLLLALFGAFVMLGDCSCVRGCTCTCTHV